MMTEDDYRHFVCIVAGDEPEKLMKEYDINKKVDPYVVYRISDAGKIKESMLIAYRDELAECDEDSFEREDIEDTIKYVEGLSELDAFNMFTYYYDKDPKTGDAISTENKNGKWDAYNIGRLFSVPFYTIDGREVYQEMKKNVAWSLIHGSNKDFYRKVWNMVLNGEKPTNEKESAAYENMKDRIAYFKKFGDIETYVASNTAFWGYAFLSEKTGWIELLPNDNQFVWMSTYYDRFINNLPDDTKLTIYECRRL